MVIYEKEKLVLFIPKNNGNYEIGDRKSEEWERGYISGYTDASATSVNLTQEEYDALEDKKCNTYYNIVEEE